LKEGNKMIYEMIHRKYGVRDILPKKKMKEMK